MPKTLAKFVESVSGTSHLRVEEDFGDGFVRLQTSEAERRQAAQDIQSSENIVLEMLRNARDAHATHIFVAVSREGKKRSIVMVDDGCGIPESKHELVFEPRVTSKLDTSQVDAWGIHGRGMALFSIAQNSERAFIVASEIDRGCAICVETDLRTLPEKADQSSFPTFLLGEGNKVIVRGPRNILRTVCEFAIECRAQCSVYIGSPAEIIATMYSYGMATLSVIDRVFPSADCAVPLTKCLAQAGDPASLAAAAERVGLVVSERTARRILDGEIDALDPVLDQISLQRTDASQKRRKERLRRSGERSFKLQQQDASELSEAVMGAFVEIAERHYLESDVRPIVTSRNDRITVTIPIAWRQ